MAGVARRWAPGNALSAASALGMSARTAVIVGTASWAAGSTALSKARARAATGSSATSAGSMTGSAAFTCPRTLVACRSTPGARARLSPMACRWPASSRRTAAVEVTAEPSCVLGSASAPATLAVEATNCESAPSSAATCLTRPAAWLAAGAR